MIKQFKIFIFIQMLCLMTYPALADGPNIRGLNNDPVLIQNRTEPRNQAKDVTDTNKQQASTKVNLKKTYTLKGNLSELISVVGKSQLIRFDEPVKRISITNPALADLILLSPKEMLLNGKQAGLTSLIIWGEKGDPAFFNLYVKNDSSQFLNTLKTALPNENLDLKFTNDSNVVLSGKVSSAIVKDQVKDLAQAYGLKLVDISESPAPQVMIEVKIAEASRSFIRNLGTTYALGKLSAGSLTPLNVDTMVDYGKAADFLGGLNGVRLISHQGDLTALINAAEQKGLVKILAEPKLLSTNGNKASFNAGQELPYPSSVDRNGNLAYEYKNVGVNVSFTPTIMEKSARISLNIAPEVSQIDSSAAIKVNNSIVIYGIKTRKANTTVELNNGQTLIMAGLIQKTDNSLKSQIPLLGEIPILGQFFRSDEYRKDETELLIFVTPKIIRPDQKTDGV